MQSDFQRTLRLVSQLNGGDIRAVYSYNQAIYAKMRDYLARPDKAILTNLYMPQEIFIAMNLPTLFTEFITGTLAAAKRTLDMIAATERVLQSSGLCNYITSIIGFYEEGQLPPPKFFIAPSEICEDPPKVFEYLSSRFGSSYYYIDIPFSEDEKTVAYVARQLEDMVDYLEEHTGQRLSMKKLTKVIRLSNEARYYGLKIRELRKRNRPLMLGRGGVQIMGLYTLLGTREGLDILKDLYFTLKDRAARGFKPLQDSEYRLYWIHQFPPYAIKILDYLERKLKAAIVVEEVMDVPSMDLDEEKPFISLARKILSHPAHGTVANRVNLAIENAIEYQVDGVINYSPIGCRLGRCGVPFLKERFKQIDIPFIELISDSIDFRNYSEAQLQTRLEAFVEIMRNKRTLSAAIG